MRNVLLFTLLPVLFAGCKIDDDKEGCYPPPQDEFVEVIVHEYEDSNNGIRGIVATLPDGSVSRKLFLGSHYGYPQMPTWPSIGSDGKSLLFSDAANQYSYVYSLLEGRVTCQFPDFNSGYPYPSHGYYNIHYPNFSYDMQEIFGVSYATEYVNSVSVDDKFVTPLDIHTSIPVSMTGDNQYFLWIETVADPVGGGEVRVIKYADRSGRNAKILKTFDSGAQSEIVAITAVPSPRSHEFIYLLKTSEGFYRLVKADIDGGEETEIDSFEATYEITNITVNADVNRVAYFETIQNENKGSVVVRNYSGDSSADIVYILKDQSWNYYDKERLRAHLSVIRSDIWDSLPAFETNKKLN